MDIGGHWNYKLCCRTPRVVQAHLRGSNAFNTLLQLRHVAGASAGAYQEYLLLKNTPAGMLTMAELMQTLDEVERLVGPAMKSQGRNKSFPASAHPIYIPPEEAIEKLLLQVIIHCHLCALCLSVPKCNADIHRVAYAGGPLCPGSFQGPESITGRFCQLLCAGTSWLR